MSQNVTWSPSGLAYRNANGGSSTARDFQELVSALGFHAGCVLISHRNSIIRTTKVPNLKGSQLEQMIRAKANALAPNFGASYSFGYRLGADPSGAGKVAILGGAKSETISKILNDAANARFKVSMLIPAAFASWAAAIEKGIRDGLILCREGDDVCFDIVSGGELLYSRFTQVNEPHELAQEIESSFESAGLTTGNILALGNWTRSDFPAYTVEIDPREPAEFLRGPQIVRSLFTLELPEAAVKREKATQIASASRGIVLGLAAVAAWSFVIFHHQELVSNQQDKARIQAALDRGEREKVSAAQAKANDAEGSATLIDYAFDPAQTFSDVVGLLAQDSSPKITLTGLSMERGEKFSIRGQSQDQKSVYAYVKALRKESRFRDVQLIFITEGLKENLPIYQFSISGWPIGNIPFNRQVSVKVK